ncbi:MAG: dihydroorotate dehydrogenase [Planctomycetia bacterium]|nr:dihydroorotate dehydrogenase [Planctomycetia bacterium]
MTQEQTGGAAALPVRASLAVQLGQLRLPNPILVASGTFGYAKEMPSLVHLSRLGAIIPKTITVDPRSGNRPPRTVETASGLLNAIGLDNDGLDEFIDYKMPYLASIGAPIIVSIAAKELDEAQIFGEALSRIPGIVALELNVSCPNVSGGVDFGTDPRLCEKMVRILRRYTSLPFAVKLSPNVTNIGEIALACQEGGANMIAAINTCYGLAVDWRRRRPRLGNGCGGLSGPAIKPIALRCIHQIHKAVQIPIIGIGGITSLDDVMEFLVAGASAVEIGTANFFQPDITMQILDQLPNVMAELGIESLGELVGTLEMP